MSDEPSRSTNNEPNESLASDGAKYIHEAIGKVAEIGEGRRWYDLPYMLLSWLQGSWPKRVLPRRWRSGLNHLLNLLIPFDEHWDNSPFRIELRWE